MSTSSKSVRAIVRSAYAVGTKTLPEYSRDRSPHKFTQAQLFGCLVLKETLKRDYRGVTQFLEDFRESREELELRTVPHFTTLHKASKRLLSQRKVIDLLETTLKEFSFKKAV